jgi:hypothetical protein
MVGEDHRRLNEEYRRARDRRGLGWPRKPQRTWADWLLIIGCVLMLLGVSVLWALELMR